MSLRFLLLLSCVVALAPVAGAQNQPPPPTGPIRVFLDCQSLRCDFDHLRREILFVAWVRDRTAADVHVLGTSRGAGAGGQEVTLAFIGLGRFARRVDTLNYSNGSTDTDAERRDRLTRLLSAGLVPYAVRQRGGPRLRIARDGAATPAQEADLIHDPWDHWVFRLSGNASVEGETRQSEMEFRGSASANRVTEAWKLRLNGSIEYGREEFELDSGQTFVATQRSWDFSYLTVWSLGSHWSVGAIGEVWSSQFRNHRVAIETGPAFEYSLFPYDESSRRRITMRYAAGVGAYQYRETTVFGKIEEVRPLHDLNVSLNFRQPWGNMYGGVGGSQYLDDLAQHRVEVFGGIDLRLIRGLSLFVNGAFARVKNQVNLAAGDLSPEEIIVRQRQLGTDYEYDLSVGLSFTFGSIFSNVVNPRF